MELIRVGQFLAHYPAPGGSASVLRGLSSGLLELGQEVVVYGYGPAGGQVLDGVLERSFTPPRIRRRGLAAFSRGDELTRRLVANADRLDVLIIHGMFSPFSMRIMRAAREGGIRTVAQPHDPYSPALFVERRIAKLLYWRLFERRFLCSVDAIQLYAPSHREHLVRLGVDTQTFVVPAGISRGSLERVAEMQQRREIASPDVVRLLYVGRFDIYNKGLDLLLQAVAATTGVSSRILVDYVGARESSEYEAMACIVRRLGLTDRVRLSYRTEAPWAAFARADLFVLPSRFDGFGLVVLEALAVGTPVVLSSAAGAAEFLGDDEAVIVTQPSVEGLQRTLLEATSRLDELRVAARGANVRIGESLSWRACAEQWVRGVTDLRLVPPLVPAAAKEVTS